MARETFADRLKRLAARANLKEADIASASGISATTAGRLLDGTTKTIKLEEALKLCHRLGVSPWELAGEPEPSAAGASPSAEFSVRLQELEDAVGQLHLEQRDQWTKIAGAEALVARAIALLGRETGLPADTILRMQRELQQPA